MKVRLLLLLACCSTCRNTSEARVLQMDEKEAELVVGIGQKAATQLTEQLKSALMKAIREGGASNAIDVCSQQALHLTQEIALQNPGTGIKRTTFKFRNPGNAPDRLEREALTYFEDLAAAGEDFPPHFLQKVQEGEAVYYRYYQPLKTNALCLTCHGSPAGELAEMLNKRYPEDQAVGYNEGEFRGLIRVQVDQF